MRLRLSARVCTISARLGLFRCSADVVSSLVGVHREVFIFCYLRLRRLPCVSSGKVKQVNESVLLPPVLKGIHADGHGPDQEEKQEEEEKILKIQ